MIPKVNKQEQQDLIEKLRNRFGNNETRHKGIKWEDVLEKINSNEAKIYSLLQMEATGGEPDVIDFDKATGEYIFMDCSAESPKGRRSICYDQQALDSRKEHKPVNSAVKMAEEMGIALLDEEQYRKLQTTGIYDSKTSSWIITPNDIRQLGGALFADYRYGKVFVYHNGAESYYSSRGFRGMLRV